MNVKELLVNLELLAGKHNRASRANHEEARLIMMAAQVVDLGRMMREGMIRDSDGRLQISLETDSAVMAVECWDYLLGEKK